MGSLETRLSRVEEKARERALRECVELVTARTDEEIAAAFADPYNPVLADTERLEALLRAAGGEEEERMKEVVAALLEALRPRKASIRRRIERLRREESDG